MNIKLPKGSSVVNMELPNGQTIVVNIDAFSDGDPFTAHMHLRGSNRDTVKVETRTIDEDAVKSNVTKEVCLLSMDLTGKGFQ